MVPVVSGRLGRTLGRAGASARGPDLSAARQHRTCPVPLPALLGFWSGADPNFSQWSLRPGKTWRAWATSERARRASPPGEGYFEGMKLDLLAIAAHPDDAELTCGGTLAWPPGRGTPSASWTSWLERRGPAEAPRSGPTRRKPRAGPRHPHAGQRGTERRAPAQHRRRAPAGHRAHPPVPAAYRDSALPRRPSPRPPRRLRAGTRRMLSRRPAEVRRAGQTASAVQNPVRPRLPRRPGEADLRHRYHVDVHRQDEGHPLLRVPVRRRPGRWRNLPDRPAPVRAGRNPERPLRLADPGALRRALLHPRNRPGRDVVALGGQSM